MHSFHKQQSNKNKLSQAAKAHEYPELFQEHDMLCIWHETTQTFSVILIALAYFFMGGILKNKAITTVIYRQNTWNSVLFSDLSLQAKIQAF